MNKRKLTADQDKVLLFLYERKDDGAPNIERIATGVNLSVASVKRIINELMELGLVQGPPSLLDQCAATLKEIDDKMTPTSGGYAEAILLLASYVTNRTDETFLAGELDYDREFVETVGSRLRASGIWTGDALPQSQRKLWEDDAVSFWIDVNIAKGNVKVVGEKNGERQFQMTDSGLADAARLIKGINS